ncbi:isthmin-1-like [Corticium candelabrum]|uniref:isthmin-1-like n=1 Tax=Corticium candelabrum TaxID=121492 RepID=UPI002E255548|nr:isthmin-1-like [Corticium candelabrum]
MWSLLVTNVTVVCCLALFWPVRAASISTQDERQAYPLTFLDTLESSIGGSGFPDETNETEDCCAKWFECGLQFDQTIKAIFDELPACPCFFHPQMLPFGGRIEDPKHKRHFRWRDVTQLFSNKLPRQEPAEWCIEQKPEPGKLAAQHCCYNNSTMLITRGSGAGSPRLVSPSRFFLYHEKFDIQPWIDCKGDWTRYHAMRPPNNDLLCHQNPSEKEYRLQRLQAQSY